MFGSIGGFEMIVLAIIGLLVFGPRKLPEIGRTLGKAMVEFRRAALELRTSIEREVNLEEVRETTRTIQKAMTGDLVPGAKEILPALEKEAAGIVEEAAEAAAPPPAPAPAGGPARAAGAIPSAAPTPATGPAAASAAGPAPAPATGATSGGAGTTVSGTEARGTTDAARRD